jgi:hypothetical protein
VASAAVSRPAGRLLSEAVDDDGLATRLLGRPPQAPWRVAVADGRGRPVVLENAPVTYDGRPMPTRFWLVDARLVRAVGRLEAAGGVRAAASAVDPRALARAHRDYADRRDRLLGPDHVGPRPTGGVGGTARGVKCLHAHLANWLAGGDDPVGRYVVDALEATGEGVWACSGRVVRVAVEPGWWRRPGAES